VAGSGWQYLRDVLRQTREYSLRALIRATGRAVRRPRHEVEFLPAALEIIETPPSPIGRAVSLALMAVFLLALAWSVLGHVDIVAVAPGKIVASGRSKLIQPLEAGVVRRIHVHEGQAVAAGEPLLELDPTDTVADSARLEAEQNALQLALARLEAMLTALRAGQGGAQPEFSTPAAAPEEQARAEAARMRQEYEEQAQRMEEAAAREAEQRAALQALQQEHARAVETLPLIEKRTLALKSLSARGLAAEQEYLALKQQFIETRQQREALKARMAEAEAAVRAAAAQRRALASGAEKAWLAQQQEARTRLEAVQQEMEKTARRRALQTLTSPVAGVVQELAVHTVGGVVTPAQQLMVVAPSSGDLGVEALLRHSDIAFVQPEQEAVVKVDALPFTRHGALRGRVQSLSQDAVQDEKLGLVFAVRVALIGRDLPAGARRIAVAPGMGVSVEITTGRRRLIEYLLDPVLRRAQESARER
jgi:hemolysin D